MGSLTVVRGVDTVAVYRDGALVLKVSDARARQLVADRTVDESIRRALAAA